MLGEGAEIIFGMIILPLNCISLQPVYLRSSSQDLQISKDPILLHIFKTLSRVKTCRAVKNTLKFTFKFTMKINI